MPYDTALLALIAGLAVSVLMRYDTSLVENTRGNATWLALGFFVALIILASVDGCKFLLSFIRMDTACNNIVTARENFTVHVLGVEPANQVGAISGAVGFVLVTSGTRSKKWLSLGGLLFVISMYVIFRTIWPSQ